MKHRHHHNFNFIKEISKVTKPISHQIQISYPKVSHDLGSVLKGTAHTITTVTGQVGHTIEATSNSLAIPLAIGAVCLVGFFIMKNK